MALTIIRKTVTAETVPDSIGPIWCAYVDLPEKRY